MIGDDITLELGDNAIPVRVPRHCLAYAAGQVVDNAGNLTNVFKVTLFHYTQEDLAQDRDPFVVLDAILTAETDAFNAAPDTYVYRHIEPRCVNTRTVVIVTPKDKLPTAREEHFMFKRGAKGYWEAVDINSASLLLSGSLRTISRPIQP